MWVFAKHGFTSAVAYDPKKDRNKKSKFPEIAKQAGTHILVRARVKEDIEDIKRVLPTIHIEEDLSADYQYRAVVPRAVFKRYLAQAVDDIDYDSHFKEATSAAAKGAKNRHSAMMKVWDAMADLQPNPPYGNSWTSYGSGDWVGGGYVSPHGSDAKKSVPTTMLGPAPEHVDDLTAEDADSYRTGKGPKHGFKKGDEVVGFNGIGTVTKVEVREATADLVMVEFDDKKKSGRFLSNFLCPTGLDDAEVLTIDDAYDWFTKADGLDQEFPADWLAALEEDAFEFVTRVSESREDGQMVGKEDLDRIYDEVMWESLSGEEKKRWVLEGTVPEKFEGEAMRILNSLSDESATHA